MTPSIEEMERLFEGARRYEGYCDDAVLLDAARTFVPQAIAALRAKDREIEELRTELKLAQYEAGEVRRKYLHFKGKCDRLDAAKGTKA